MKRQIINYILSILFLIIFIFVITYSYLNTNFSQKGNIDYKKKYYDIVYNNVTIDYDTTMKVKLDSENDTIKVRVNDLNEFKKANSFSIDLTNIGSINAKIKNIRILNIQSNVELQDVNIDISTAKDDIINGGETIKLIICIKYNGKKIIENPYYFFDIKYDFDEVVL
ncbi:MAG: hypothetical protein MR938_02190 [Tenericutes bacterium]|nr:hypothetical protein [Mycoplasmatota bacterium]